MRSTAKVSLGLTDSLDRAGAHERTNAVLTTQRRGRDGPRSYSPSLPCNLAHEGTLAQLHERGTLRVTPP